MSFRKDILVKLGGFDERYDGNAFRWETDMGYRLKKAGFYTLYDPTVFVLHQYNSPGGCNNANLFGRSARSHGWYYYFFKNSVYFHLKNIGGPTFIHFVWKLYRGHVLNRPYLQEGIRFHIARHRAFGKGLTAGVATYWDYLRAHEDRH